MSNLLKKAKNKIIKKWYIFLYWAQNFDWYNLIAICISVVGAILVFQKIEDGIDFNPQSTLSNLLTINGVFSAILITYLFSRIFWIKDRKLETWNEAELLSQKITEFRRILAKLTDYYNVWDNDAATKSLLDHTKFKRIDYYDYQQSGVSDYQAKDQQLIDELRADPNHIEGISNVYLAMKSILRDRKRDWYWQQELYKDFKVKGIYTLPTVKRWLSSNIFGSISYWLNNQYQQIKYQNLRDHHNFIIETAGRFDSKYSQYSVDNKLIREMSEDIENHYLPELQDALMDLQSGIKGLTLIIITLITLSVLFGVLIPFIFMIIRTNDSWFEPAVRYIAAINTSLIIYFILIFPILIRRELKLNVL